MNLDANNPSTISNKPKPGQNPSIIPQQQRNPGPQVNQERVNQVPNTQQFVQQQNQQVNVSSASSNFLSQGNSNSVISSRANQQNDPFSSFPQSTLNTRVQQQTLLNVNQQNGFASLDVNLAVYPAPHPISPLGKHLSKLVPPNDQVMKFFNELFA
jgi:hypothetical protein